MNRSMTILIWLMLLATSMLTGCEKMTDEELQARIKRLEMEARVKDLEKRSGPEISRGRKVVGDILENGAKTMGNAAFNKLANEMFNGDNNYSGESAKYAKRVLSKVDSMSNDDLKNATERYNNLRILEGRKRNKKD